MPSFDAHKNFAISTVTNAPGTGGVTIEVNSGTGTRFPSTPFNATVWPASAIPTLDNAEIVRVTGLSGDTLTVTRARESTSSKPIAAGYYIAATVTAKTVTDLEGIALGTQAVSPAVLMAEQGSAPSTPASGFALVYVGTDKDLHILDSAGLDTGLITAINTFYATLAAVINAHDAVLAQGTGISGTFSSVTVVDGIVSAGTP